MTSANSVPDRSPNYEAIGKDIQKPFEKHFTRLVTDHETTTLIDYEEGRVSNVIGAEIINTLLKTTMKKRPAGVAEKD